MAHPGQTFNLDYSLTRTFPLQRSSRLQLGLVGYGQWQTTDKQAPNITPQLAAAHYKVNTLGFTANAVLPGQKVNMGVKYFHELIHTPDLRRDYVLTGCAGLVRHQFHATSKSDRYERQTSLLSQQLSRIRFSRPGPNLHKQR